MVPLDADRRWYRYLHLFGEWGLLAVFPCLIGTLMLTFGDQPPFIIGRSRNNLEKPENRDAGAEGTRTPIFGYHLGIRSTFVKY
jgi:hypothetical protein